MVDQELCNFLERVICKVFEHSDNDQIKGFWCDGVLLSEYMWLQWSEPAFLSLLTGRS